MDRENPARPFSIANQPEWGCPTCNRGVLRIVSDSFCHNRRLHSRDTPNHEHDADWIEYVYSCLLRCSNEACHEAVSNSGTGRVETNTSRNEHGDWEAEYVDMFESKFFEPHLRLINIPNKCPTTVVNALNESFKLFFAAPSAAANSVRIAIEALLTELNVEPFTIVKDKQKPINLHARIDLLPAKYENLKAMLKAIKWIGNVGSHRVGEITHDDVLTAYRFMEYLFKEIYAPREELASLAEQINRNKGPIK